MCDGEAPEAFWDETRRARKPHVCFECQGVIQVGELYYYCRGIWDHTPGSHKLHIACQKLLHKPRYHGEGENSHCSVPFGCLEEYMMESQPSGGERPADYPETWSWFGRSLWWQTGGQLRSYLHRFVERYNRRFNPVGRAS